MQCFKCGTDLGAVKLVSRHDACPKCAGDLKCCRNCTHYEPKCNNECREPSSERIVDKEKSNFCEFFEPSGKQVLKSERVDPRAAADALFKKK